MKVSWDDFIPNIWKVIKIMFQATNPTKSCLRIVHNDQYSLNLVH